MKSPFHICIPAHSGLSPNMWNVTVGPASFVFICFWYMKTSWMLHLRKLALWHPKHYTWGLQLWRTAVPALPHSRWVDVGGWWPADPTAVLRLTAFLFKIHLCGLCAVWQWGGHSSAISSTKYLFCFFLNQTSSENRVCMSFIARQAQTPARLTDAFCSRCPDLQLFLHDAQF